MLDIISKNTMERNIGIQKKNDKDTLTPGKRQNKLTLSQFCQTPVPKRHTVLLTQINPWVCSRWYE